MRNFCRQWRTREDPEQANDKFPGPLCGAALSDPQVILDVQQFSPDEITVKTVDNHVVVEAKHEEKQDEHGWISRQFVRKYMIPEQCDIDQVTSSLSSDGMLSITAPRKDKPKTQNERAIKIEHTGKPAIQEKVQEKAQEKSVTAEAQLPEIDADQDADMEIAEGVDAPVPAEPIRLAPAQSGIGDGNAGPVPVDDQHATAIMVAGRSTWKDE